MVEEKDDRPLVKDLLEEHASNLQELRSILEKEDTYSKEHYDDIWMLRFLLSHRKVSKASTAAIKTMTFRQEKRLNEMGDIRHRIADHRDHESNHNFDIVKKYFRFCNDSTAVMHAQPDNDRGVVQIIFPGQVDMHQLVENMSSEEVAEAIMMINEVMYQILDDVTKRTGKLTKTMKILDCSDFGLRSFNREFFKRDSAAYKQMENFYPQLLGAMIVVNIGTWFTLLWKALKHLLPKGVVAKINFVQCTPGKNSNDAKYFLEYISKDNLWERYGGNCKDWPVTPPTHLWEK